MDNSNDILRHNLDFPVEGTMIMHRYKIFYWFSQGACCLPVPEQFVVHHGAKFEDIFSPARYRVLIVVCDSFPPPPRSGQGGGSCGRRCVFPMYFLL